MSLGTIIGLASTACIASFVATGAVLRLLRRRAVLDHPNERSSHHIAIPRGGGLAVMAVIVISTCLLAWQMSRNGSDSFNLFSIACLTAVLAGISFIDDLRGLPALQRLLWQALAVALGCLALPDDPVFQGLLPPVLDRLVAAVCWLWFINLFNFMDGIDGITAVETTCISLGVVAVGLSQVGDSHLASTAAIIGGAAVGFGIWNWRPAQIFLGDVGSVGLGFILGWILLSLASEGYWLPALLLPLYYLCDATWTLFRRALRGEKVWKAHRSHFYQYAAQASGDHGWVAMRILFCNLVLLAAAIWAVVGETSWKPLALGSAAVAFLLWYFAKMKNRA